MEEHRGPDRSTPTTRPAPVAPSFPCNRSSTHPGQHEADEGRHEPAEEERYQHPRRAPFRSREVARRDVDRGQSSLTSLPEELAFAVTFGGLPR